MAYNCVTQISYGNSWKVQGDVNYYIQHELNNCLGTYYVIQGDKETKFLFLSTMVLVVYNPLSYKTFLEKNLN